MEVKLAQMQAGARPLVQCRSTREKNSRIAQLETNFNTMPLEEYVCGMAGLANLRL